ncbi:LADA_0C09670g1_1 [Lachancea dasiensis]|uniref:LADA_0C09670g1_1 n=1 Tax=Lachancea dasiensis TaxID=1072105 RepID=A0A1G4J185_9SACH|nr:LADA_0C09670g1_1 [Lachancea dasiensis]
MFRKRVKLQNSVEGSVSSQNRQVTHSAKKPPGKGKIDISESYDDDDDQVETISVKTRPISTPVDLINVAGADNPRRTHDITFSAKQNSQILNLDNLDEDFDDGDEDELMFSVPSHSEIKRIRELRALQQQRVSPTGTGFFDSSHEKPVEFNEAAYVKLLNEEDKLDLLETLGERTAGNDKTDVLSEPMSNAFDDKPLALSEQELRRDESERKTTILNALDDVQDNEWESQQISKNENGYSIASLPITHGDDFSLDSVLSELKTLVLKAQQKEKINFLRRDALQGERETLLNLRSSLTSKLEKLAFD